MPGEAFEVVRCADRAGRMLVGTLTAEGEVVRVTIIAEDDPERLLYDRRFPTIARARIALKASLGVRAKTVRRRSVRVRVITRPDRDGFFLVYRVNGKRYCKRARGDRKAANALARAFEEKLQRIVNGLEPSRTLDAPTLGTFASTVIEARWAQRVKPSTLDVYRSILKIHLAPRLGSRRLDAITRTDLKGYAYDLLRDGKAPATVRRIFAVLRIVLNEAVDDEMLSGNPMHGLRLGTLLKGAVTARSAEGETPDATDADPVRCLTPAELASLIDAAKAAWPFEHYVFLLVLARTGMRIGEAAGLQWGDLDLETRVAAVRRTCRGERTSTPKSGKGRRVYLSPQLVDALRDLWRQCRVVSIDDGQRARAWVFPDKRTASKPMEYRRFYERFVPLAKSLAMRGVTPHTLRHTYASLLFAQGKTMHFVQDQLGHHDPKFTASVYGHLIPGDRGGEVDFLDSVGRQVDTLRNTDAAVSSGGDAVGP